MLGLLFPFLFML